VFTSTEKAVVAQISGILLEYLMIALKQTPRLERPILLSSLAAQVLGHSRVNGNAGFTPRQMTMAFPAFSEFEISWVLTELVDKRLATKKGQDGKAIYSLTDAGLTGRVGVS
jgi:hypothetical protein